MIITILAACIGGILGYIGYGWRTPVYWLIMALLLAMVLAAKQAGAC